MNNTDTVKAIAPIVSSYFREETGAEMALRLIGSVLKENRVACPAANGRELKKDPTGFRVIDLDGGAHEYPNARAVQADRDYLRLLDENNDAIAIFRRWEHAERITK